MTDLATLVDSGLFSNPFPTVPDAEEWLSVLGAKLAMRQRRYRQLEDYYRGDHPLPESGDRARSAFRVFQRKARTNYMSTVADAVSERLQVVGFRTGGDGSADADADAWAIWQANHLDADQGVLFETATKFPDAYVIVGPAPTGSEYPLITIEDPRTVIAAVDPCNRRTVRAALKMWFDELDRHWHAVVYLPGSISYFQGMSPMTEAAGSNVPMLPSTGGSWTTEQAPEENTLGVVPVVRFVARPQLSGDGLGEFEGNLTDIQDRINETTFQRMVITRSQAYRQRWAKGIATKDEDGNAIDLPFIPGEDILWAVDDLEVEFGDFSEANLVPILSAISADVTSLAVQAALPPTYIDGNIVNIAADTVAAIQDRLVSKIDARSRQHGESLEQVLSLAFTYMGQPDRIGSDSEVIWGDFERRSISQLADAAVKMGAAGVPWDTRMTTLGYSPQERIRMREERKADAVDFNQPPEDFSGSGGVAKAVEPPSEAV